MVIMVWATGMFGGICLETADDGDSLPIFVVSPSAPLSPRPSVQAELQSAPSLLTVHAVSFKTSVGRLLSSHKFVNHSLCFLCPSSWTNNLSYRSSLDDWIVIRHDLSPKWITWP